jgi:hypothetical protein
MNRLPEQWLILIALLRCFVKVSADALFYMVETPTFAASVSGSSAGR